ncbi:Fanconi anemia group C protein-like isoform X2 [Sinocyclocheilus anshuiensis]|uniref:Fanconi anemia group C protein-like isoform X2 n=1 Tax=Sinocyclocheilus anshuiensis TaxID=1608454 RepID=UPI0007B98A20|nr:PREDICTED: Fanconi anemia group C protein-like isoform X2 [Sinocyclocheilus anshuiensis]
MYVNSKPEQNKDVVRVSCCQTEQQKSSQTVLTSLGRHAPVCGFYKLEKMEAVSETDVQFWMAKAVNWGEATSCSALLDTSRHLGSLRSFLQQVLQGLQQMSSTSEAMKTFPFVGQFLGRLCWNPCVIADERSQRLLLRCLNCLYSAEPLNAVEQKANMWIKSSHRWFTISNTGPLAFLPDSNNMLCHLISEEEGSVAHATVKHAGLTPKRYHSEALQKVVSLMTEEVIKSCDGLPNTSAGCSNGNIHAMSTACAALVTCPQISPLIGALLKHSMLCGFSCLNQEFIKEVSEALISKRLVLEDEAVVNLWCYSPTCLEGAAVSLLESVLSDHETMTQSLDKHVNGSLLPQASADHCHIFLTINEIYRNVLTEIDENLAVRALIQVFTVCFLQRLTGQKPQDRLPLRAFFPHVMPSLLTPLLTAPSEVPREAWLDHLSWIRSLLQSVTENEEAGEDVRAYQAFFEAWFLLVQCGYWVDTAAELLVLAAPENAEPLLWLLTFFHHPTNREHQRSQQTAVAREAWTHLRMLFLTRPPPPRHLSAVKELLSSSLSANLVLHLFSNFTVFSHGPVSIITEITDKVLTEAAVKRRALWILASIRCRLNSAATRDDRVHSRLRTLQDTLLQT